MKNKLSLNGINEIYVDIPFGNIEITSKKKISPYIVVKNVATYFKVEQNDNHINIGIKKGNQLLSKILSWRILQRFMHQIKMSNCASIKIVLNQDNNDIVILKTGHGNVDIHDLNLPALGVETKWGKITVYDLNALGFCANVWKGNASINEMQATSFRLSNSGVGNAKIHNSLTDYGDIVLVNGKLIGKNYVSDKLNVHSKGNIKLTDFDCRCSFLCSDRDIHLEIIESMLNYHWNCSMNGNPEISQRDLKNEPFHELYYLEIVSKLGGIKIQFNGSNRNSLVRKLQK